MPNLTKLFNSILDFFTPNKRKKVVLGENTQVEQPVLEPQKTPSEEKILTAQAPTTVTKELNKAFNSISYNRSFLSKIIQGSERLQERYDTLKNAILGYKKMKAYVSWTGERIAFGRNTVAKFAVRGKTLCLYLALNPQDYADGNYVFTDVSSVKKYENVPMLLKISSKKKVKQACELVATLAEKVGAVLSGEKTENYRFEYKDDQTLIDEGLIKIVKRKGKNLPFAEAEVAELLRPETSVFEADSIMPDEVAVSLIESREVKNKITVGKKAIINVDTLCKHFEANEKVTVESLIKKGLVTKNTGFVKVLARGVINRPLIVEANDYSIQAVKMILITGGHAFKI